jgi:hypothetical protein
VPLTRVGFRRGACIWEERRFRRKRKPSRLRLTGQTGGRTKINSLMSHENRRTVQQDVDKKDVKDINGERGTRTDKIRPKLSLECPSLVVESHKESPDRREKASAPRKWAVVNLAGFCRLVARLQICRGPRASDWQMGH